MTAQTMMALENVSTEEFRKFVYTYAPTAEQRVYLLRMVEITVRSMLRAELDVAQ